MSDTYTTSGGEVLDQIAVAHYGTRIGSTERILGANPGLAAQPLILPPGLVISLPRALATRTAAAPVKLYD